MWIRSLGLPALSFCLLLASSAGMARHEHGVEPELANLDCVAEHGDRHARERQSARTQPELADAGPRHQHFCLACHLSGKRPQLSREAVTSRIAHIETSFFRGFSSPRADLRFSSSTLRGPPAA